MTKLAKLFFFFFKLVNLAVVRDDFIFYFMDPLANYVGFYGLRSDSEISDLWLARTVISL